MALTPQQLATASSQLSSIPSGFRFAVLISIFAQIAGVTDPQMLMTNSACYQCIPDGMKMPVLISLFDEIANGETPPESEFPVEGITAYWKMDEASGQRADATGNGHLLDNAGVGSGPGALNLAATFNGTTDVLNNPGLACNGLPFTISCWVKLNVVNAIQFVIGKYNESQILGYLIGFSPSNFYIVMFDGGIIGLISVASPTVISAGVFYHVALVWDGTDLHIYVNNSKTTQAGGGFVPADASNDFIVGNAADPNQPLDGLVDEVGIWIGTALTDAQVSLLYNGGTPLPYP